MTYLSDAGRVVLSNAAQRDDLSVLPLPETLTIKGGAVKNVLAGLSKRGLIREVQSEPRQFVITRDGMIRIGVEPDDASEGPEATETEAADGAEAAAASPKPVVRPGTKQALLIDLLKRPEGATAEQIAERTGWRRHSIRGAIAGALKKKLGFNVEATRIRNVGPNQTGAKGSTTVYRIIEAELMAHKRKRGYRVHGLDSPEAEAEVAQQDLTRADLEQAIAAFEQAEKTRVGTLIGISEDGVFGSDREDWSPDQPTAFSEGLIVIPWVQILELLGRVPKGTTGRLLAAEPRRD